jgi:hypothetical protein
MPNTLNKDQTRRLAFVRYLYGVAVDQSHQPEPFAAVSLLTFHDACEMFLQIAAEHNAITFGQRAPDLMAYWSLFDEQAHLQLTSKTAINRLNKARINLKHAGVPPAHADVEGFRAVVTSFFEDNALTLLGVEFDQISLTLMVRFDDVWPAPGSEDTELGVFMGPEASHGKTKVYAGVQA